VISRDKGVTQVEIQEMEAELYCIHCQQDTIFNLTYFDNTLWRVECETCGHHMEIQEDIVKKYFSHWVERILTKPKRMTKEIEADLAKFFYTMPVRIMSKPIRVRREWKSVKRYKKHKQHANANDDVQ
jgi:Zn ribbon nucleic-acid-binding protein